VLGPESAPTVLMPRESAAKGPEFSDIHDADKVDVDSTSKLRGLNSDSIDLDLDRLATALGTGDTVSQPRAAEEVFSTEVFEASQRNRRVDLDVGEAMNGAEHPTNKFQAQTNKLKAVDVPLSELEPVTMSEVGTKLDLARAYMDMVIRKVREAFSRSRAGRLRQPETGSLAPDRIAAGLSAEMRRVAALVEYDGTEFAGWQSRRTRRACKMRWSKRWLLSRAPRSPQSAPGAPMRASTPSARSSTSTPRLHVRRALGFSVRIPGCRRPSRCSGGEVAADFHARHSAVRRTYRYYILNSSARSALQRLRSAWIPRVLDADAMHRAAQALIGEFDFSAFRSVECQSKSASAESSGSSAPRRRLGLDADHGQRLPAPHGAQHRRNVGGCSARG